MTKNHFIFSYTGNKRNEIIDVMPYIDFNDKKNIIDCFCGSSAMSYHIWKQYGNQFNYYLNDLDNKLIDIYNLLKNVSIEEIESNVNKVKNKFVSYTDDKERKAFFDNEIKKSSNIYDYIFNKKYSTLRCDLCPPLKRLPKGNFVISNECRQFISFLKCPNVYITCNNWLDVYNQFKDDDKNIILLDPPYIMSCNHHYEKQDCSIYEYLYNNNISNNKANIYLLLEDMWIIRLLFQNNKILYEYDKRYECSKKKTKHILISN